MTHYVTQDIQQKRPSSKPQKFINRDKYGGHTPQYINTFILYWAINY